MANTDYMALLDKATTEAKEFLDNPSKIGNLLEELQQKLKEVPAIGETVGEIPVMISMVKSWVKKEYEVSPKVLATMIGAFIYLVRKQDIIPDNIPVLGIADDVAVLGLALKFVSPDLNAYSQWKASH